MSKNVVNLCIQSEYNKKRTRNNSVFGHFTRSELLTESIIICIQVFRNELSKICGRQSLKNLKGYGLLK